MNIYSIQKANLAQNDFIVIHSLKMKLKHLAFQ